MPLFVISTGISMVSNITGHEGIIQKIYTKKQDGITIINEKGGVPLIIKRDSINLIRG